MQLCAILKEKITRCLDFRSRNDHPKAFKAYRYYIKATQSLSKLESCVCFNRANLSRCEERVDESCEKIQEEK